MIYEEVTSGSRTRRTLTGAARVLFALKIDGPLVIGLALIAAYGLIVLYSASGQNMPTIYRTVARLAIGTVAMLLLAQINPNFLRRSTPWLYAVGVPAAAGGRGHRPHRHGRAALAGPEAVPLPALGADEAGGADDVRLVPARAPAAPELAIARWCWRG